MGPFDAFRGAVLQIGNMVGDERNFNTHGHVFFERYELCDTHHDPEQSGIQHSEQLFGHQLPSVDLVFGTEVLDVG